MAKRLVLNPSGWPLPLGECPPGFFVFEDDLCFKTEYRTEQGKMEVYCCSGEFFCAGTSSEEQKAGLIVQPVEPDWEEYET
jgi:hypothetical protein